MLQRKVVRVVGGWVRQEIKLEMGRMWLIDIRKEEGKGGGQTAFWRICMEENINTIAGAVMYLSL